MGAGGLISGTIKPIIAHVGPGGESDARLTFMESLAVGQVEAADFELTRSGRRYVTGYVNGVAGQAPQTTLPTTQPGWLAYNPVTSPYTCVIDELGLVLLGGTATAGFNAYAGMCAPGSLPSTLPTANTASVVCGSCSSGLVNKRANLIVVGGTTQAAAPANGYFLVAVYPGAATTALSGATAVNYEVNGSIVIPPGHGLALGACENGAGTAPTFIPHIKWHEIATYVE